jgi:hypothetical protein
MTELHESHEVIRNELANYLIYLVVNERPGHVVSWRKLGVGGAERDRTVDLRLAKPALSQLSYSPALCARRGGAAALRALPRR